MQVYKYCLDKGVFNNPPHEQTVHGSSAIN